MLNRRQFLRSAGLAAAAQEPKRPNVVLVMADDLGYECLSANGSTSYRTPNLDRIAASGIRFTHAYAQPLCTPTRSQLMTGRYVFRNWKAFGVMDPKETTFGHHFRNAGYQTAITGKWQLYSYNPPDFEPEWRGKGMKPEQSGFHEYCLWHDAHTEDKGSRYGDPTVNRNGRLQKNLTGQYGDDIFCDFAMKFAERNRGKPFFLYYPMALTHGPFMPTPRSEYWSAGRRLKAGTENFKDMVEYMDEVVGRLYTHLDKLKLLANTLFLFYSDNGTDKQITSRMGDRIVKGGKGLTTDAGTHVPMIAAWKGVAPAGRVNGDLIDSVDFLPTIAQAAGFRLPSGQVFDGESFLPQLRGERGRPREWQFCHYDPRPGHDKEQYRLLRYARTERYKLYDDGRLYDIPADEKEEHPLAAGAGTPESDLARQKLAAVLARYGNLARPKPAPHHP
ncbi:MAG: sulfatase-like hydrolase/transferase [Bryobacterales bacterium]|nr:sulfatase-like hydrolase/transferase [Bryobacterales bacterium]